MEKVPTKDRIMHASAKLFSEAGYEKVSMRDIAAAAGIKAASIYNHFASKRDILKAIYKFYAEQHRLIRPSLESLLALVETEDPIAVLKKTILHFPSESIDTMTRALLIANMGIAGEKDGESERFIWECLFEPSMNLTIPLLNRMIELGKIESLDVSAFAYLLTYYGFSAVVFRNTIMKISEEQWQEGLSTVYSAIKVISPAPPPRYAPDERQIPPQNIPQ